MCRFVEHGRVDFVDQLLDRYAFGQLHGAEDNPGFDLGTKPRQSVLWHIVDEGLADQWVVQAKRQQVETDVERQAGIDQHQVEGVSPYSSNVSISSRLDTGAMP